MLHLTLAGLSGDNRRLLLVSDSGEKFSLAIDNKLRAALRGEHARIGQLEIQMESTLRPRDIQARIRAGESPESVAQAANTSVEKILPYASPVLAERAHVADRAQRASVRRKAGDSGARTLGQAVAAQLSPLNLHSDVVEWDSWRREDGRWILTGSYTAGKRKGTAQFVFDAPGNYVTTENDDARWLVGEPTSASPRAERRDDLSHARQRRLEIAAEDELPLGEDALEIANDAAHDVTDADADEPTVDLSATVESVREAEPAPVEDEDEDPQLSSTPEPLADPARTPSAETEKATTDQEKPAEATPPRKPARKKGRASVPSWDEIMFGGGKQD